MISENNLKQLIEPHFYNDLKKDNYEEKILKLANY